MTSIKTGNTELFFHDWGNPEGRPVVLIHGWPLSHRMWEPQVNDLADAGYRVISYDRRGFGDSGKPWTGYDYDTMAQDTKNLLDALDLRDAALIGFSMGGGEVARYVGNHGSHRINQAGLISAVTPYMLKTDDNPSGVEEEVFDDMMRGVKEDRIAFLDGFGKNFVNWEEANQPISQDMLHYLKTVASFASPKATQDCITAFAKTDFREDLKRFDIPTLIVHGEGGEARPQQPL